MEIRRAEAAQEALELSVAFLTMENAVDRLNRPALVEDDLIVKEAFLVIDHSGVMQIAQQLLYGGYISLLRVTEFLKVLITDRAIAFVGRGAGFVLVQIVKKDE